MSFMFYTLASNETRGRLLSRCLLPLISFSLKKKPTTTDFVGGALEGLSSSAKMFVATNHSHTLTESVMTENLSKGTIVFASAVRPLLKKTLPGSYHFTAMHQLACCERQELYGYYKLAVHSVSHGSHNSNFLTDVHIARRREDLGSHRAYVRLPFLY